MNSSSDGGRAAPASSMPYLHQRWSEGCTTARGLFEELRECGYEVARASSRSTCESSAKPSPRRSAPQESLGAGRDQLDHPAPDRLNDDQVQQLKAVLARCPELEQTAQHIRAFAELMNNREGRHLGQWIDRVQADDLPTLHSFVNGLGQDLDAVVAGLSLRYSSGAVEGHNNKIKMLKRQMFGRANFDLLRKRVLLAA
ncbi:transposase [Streptomyces sp. NPDC060000]|uniref:transposase n=1 Tax=Streptomyces sp. NPDC060000 TaxID=3347031 RepID=UPI00367DB956